jgi:hypothetical protein
MEHWYGALVWSTGMEHWYGALVVGSDAVGWEGVHCVVVGVRCRLRCTEHRALVQWEGVRGGWVGPGCSGRADARAGSGRVCVEGG